MCGDDSPIHGLELSRPAYCIFGVLRVNIEPLNKAVVECTEVIFVAVNISLSRG